MYLHWYIVILGIHIIHSKAGQRRKKTLNNVKASKDYEGGYMKNLSTKVNLKSKGEAYTSGWTISK